MNICTKLQISWISGSLNLIVSIYVLVQTSMSASVVKVLFFTFLNIKIIFDVFYTLVVFFILHGSYS